MKKSITFILALFFITFFSQAWAWHDETHLAIAKSAGYEKWFNAAGADITKIKAGNVERRNHYVNSPPDTVITAEIVLDQVDRYNKAYDMTGHLYGAILGSIKEYQTTNLEGKYAGYHLAFCAHYVGDLSQPLHNTLYNTYNRKNHTTTDGTINDEILDNLSRIKIYPINIQSEEDLAREVARIATISINLGYQLEKEGRMLSRQEAYIQISHSASLFRGILTWLGK